MKRNEILKAIKDLANSQGYYGRMLEQLQDLEEYENEKYNTIMDELEKKNFNDMLDLVLFFES